MITRRLMFALPMLAPLLISTVPATPLRAQPSDDQPSDDLAANDLAAVLAACWLARGVRFSPAAIAARIGAARGRAALLAVAGAATDADGEDVEIAVEIVWEANQPPSPAEPLMARDLACGLPLLLLHRDGRALLLTVLNSSTATAASPITGEHVYAAWPDIVLIGRPVIAGA